MMALAMLVVIMMMVIMSFVMMVIMMVTTVVAVLLEFLSQGRLYTIEIEGVNADLGSDAACL
jgi:hypothetical protein